MDDGSKSAGVSCCNCGARLINSSPFRCSLNPVDKGVALLTWDIRGGEEPRFGVSGSRDKEEVVFVLLEDS